MESSQLWATDANNWLFHEDCSINDKIRKYQHRPDPGPKLRVPGFFFNIAFAAPPKKHDQERFRIGLLPPPLLNRPGWIKCDQRPQLVAKMSDEIVWQIINRKDYSSLCKTYTC